MKFARMRTKHCTTMCFKKFLDIGDFIGVKGERCSLPETGEISCACQGVDSTEQIDTNRFQLLR